MKEHNYADITKGKTVGKIDWSKAPGWAKEVGTDSGVMNYWMDDVSYQLFLHDKGSRVFFSNYDSKNKSSFLIVASRPEAKPVYTQAMCDAGELPSVGMECLFRHQSWGAAQHEQAEILAITKEYLLVQIKGQRCENHFHLEDITFIPLTPPIELKEKGLYLFTVGKKVGMVGEAYFTAIDEEPMLTNIRTNTSYSQAACTNIKPLTVGE